MVENVLAKFAEKVKALLTSSSAKGDREAVENL